MNTARKAALLAGLLLSVAGLGGLSYWTLSDRAAQEGEKSEESYPHERTIRYSFTIQNTTSTPVGDPELWVFGPVAKTSWQRSDSIEASHPFKLRQDELGNQILQFRFDSLPPFGSKVVSINAEVSLADSANRLPLPAEDQFLTSERYIEINHPRMQSVASLQAASDTIATAQNAFRWVKSNLQYSGYIPDDRGALYALTHKKGDCTEYSYLYTALARANGVPSRVVGGYVYAEDAVLKPEDFHNWSEIYTDGVWDIVDPQNGKFLRTQNTYIAMRIISEHAELPNTHRFAYAGAGLRVKMN